MFGFGCWLLFVCFWLLVFGVVCCVFGVWFSSLVGGRFGLCVCIALVFVFSFVRVCDVGILAVGF